MLNNVISIFESGAAAAGDYESIATVTVGSGGSSSIQFNSIATDWTHLQIRAMCLSASTPIIRLRYNSDTGTNYAFHNLRGSGAAVASSGSASQAYNQLFPNGLIAANNPAAFIIDILDYKNTNKYKTIRGLAGDDANGSGHISLISGLWMNTNAISAIEIYPDSSSFSQYSHFALYGIKSA